MNPVVVAGVAIALWWWSMSLNLPYSPLDLNKPSLTFYHASWCPHCKKAAPEWQKLGTEYRGVVIRAVEEKQNNEYPVEGFPTILWRDGKGGEKKYVGYRTAEAWKQYIDTQLS